jgi:hypothetical protein
MVRPQLFASTKAFAATQRDSYFANLRNATDL